MDREPESVVSKFIRGILVQCVTTKHEASGEFVLPALNIKVTVKAEPMP